jgi:hypothetical protein
MDEADQQNGHTHDQPADPQDGGCHAFLPEVFF